MRRAPRRLSSAKLTKKILTFFLVGLRMSHPMCYTVRMMIKETLFEVLSFDGDATLGFINARNEGHAQRVADRLFCTSKTGERVCRCLVKKVKEFNR